MHNNIEDLTKFKNGDWLVILDPTLRKQAPKDRNRLIVNSIRADGWVDITYQDGTHDYMMFTQLQQHWGLSAGQRSLLWKVLNHGN